MGSKKRAVRIEGMKEIGNQRSLAQTQGEMTENLELADIGPKTQEDTDARTSQNSYGPSRGSRCYERTKNDLPNLAAKIRKITIWSTKRQRCKNIGNYAID